MLDWPVLLVNLVPLVFESNLLKGLTVGVQFIKLGLIDECRVLVALDLGLEVVDLLLVTIDAHIVVLAEEEQHQDEGNKDEKWQVEPSGNPFGSLKLHNWEEWDYWENWKGWEYAINWLLTMKLLE